MWCGWLIRVERELLKTHNLIIYRIPIRDHLEVLIQIKLA